MLGDSVFIIILFYVSGVEQRICLFSCAFLVVYNFMQYVYLITCGGGISLYKVGGSEYASWE